MLFFVHVPKTAGSALSYAIEPSFPKGSVYPDESCPEHNRHELFGIEQFRKLPIKERRNIRFLRGHLPYCLSELFDQEIQHMVYFRNPVERIISHLRMRKQNLQSHKHLGEIYGQARFRECNLANLQCRFFAHEMTADLKTVFDVKPLDSGDVARAKQCVAQCEFIGLHEDFDDSLELLKQQFGFRFTGYPQGNVGTPYEVPAGLRERIAEDNAIDLDFYDYVSQLYWERKARSKAHAA